jgi:fatty acid-binding protein DegV
MRDNETNLSFADFEIWWEMYDKKRGKEKCLKKWAKLTKQEREDCLNATPAYVASTPDKQYRKDPQTYLNNKSWNDEIIQTSYGTRQIPTDAERISKLGEILAG